VTWTLTRAVRVNISPADQEHTGSPPGRGASGYSGIGAASGLPVHVAFEVTCRGTPDPTTWYVRDIKEIDRAVENAVIPLLTRQVSANRVDRLSATAILARCAREIDRELAGGVWSVRWRVTPYHSYEMTPSGQPATQDQAPAHADAGSASGFVVLRQRFDFAASHRLHNPALSDRENLARFGKCNNPAGHGHNYVVEPAVRVQLRNDHSTGFTFDDLDEITSRTIIRRFDHTHLNADTPEFSDRGGVLPTVENIARVCYDLLSPRIAERDHLASLVSITVWETDRTSSTYPG